LVRGSGFCYIYLYNWYLQVK